ncbi:uncharacterized protein LOC119733854 [Patiria miniata]|uniref:YqaJ viral recombinase domain-containing protein n=1 Tax=Patiria miniata TaxID=46514 RepID=A0A914AIC8_PATMI|nr:uncharacterized protein LOC119733854 [Patiria miniata]
MACITAQQEQESDTDHISDIEIATRGQASNIQWFRMKKGRITASIAKRCSGKGDPAAIVKKIITVGSPTSKPKSHHMEYGIINEGEAVSKYMKQKQDSGLNMTVMECGLFVHPLHGELAATPDRVVTENCVQGLVEVKCLSASREMTPKEAILAKQTDSNFCLQLKEAKPTLKEHHAYFYQVQMQMAVVGVAWCDFVIFTNANCDVLIVRVAFNEAFWTNVQDKLLQFHKSHVLPALVAQGFWKK